MNKFFWIGVFSVFVGIILLVNNFLNEVTRSTHTLGVVQDKIVWSEQPYISTYSEIFTTRTPTRTGKACGFEEMGDANGKHKIILLHDLIPARFVLNFINDEELKKNSLHLVILDRPGFGLSESYANKSIQSTVEDIFDLVNLLQFKQYSVVSFGVGCVYNLEILKEKNENENKKIKNIVFSGCILPEKIQDFWLQSLFSTTKVFPSFPYVLGYFFRKNILQNTTNFLNSPHFLTRFDPFLSSFFEPQNYNNIQDLTSKFEIGLKSQFQFDHFGYGQEINLLENNEYKNFKNLEKNIYIFNGENNRFSPTSVDDYLSNIFNKKKTTVKIFSSKEGYFHSYNHPLEILNCIL